MNYKRYVLLFNIFFLLLLIAATVLFQWKPGFAGNNFRPLDILSDVRNRPVKTTGPPARKGKNQPAAVLHDYKTYDGLVNTSDQPTALFEFFNKLKLLQQNKIKKLRIA